MEYIIMYIYGVVGDSVFLINHQPEQLQMTV